MNEFKYFIYNSKTLMKKKMLLHLLEQKLSNQQK